MIFVDTTTPIAERPFWFDIVEIPGLGGLGGGVRRGEAGSLLSDRDFQWRDRDELCQLPEILDGGGQQTLVFRSVWSTQAQPAHSQNVLEMRKCSFSDS